MILVLGGECNGLFLTGTQSLLFDRFSWIIFWFFDGMFCDRRRQDRSARQIPVAEATIHQLRQLRAPESLLNAATECTSVTDDDNGVRRQFDLVTGRWSWKINGVWRYEQPQQVAAVPFTGQELRVLLIMREVHLRAPHWDSRTMTKDQFVQVLQLKTAWKWDPKEAPDTTVYRICAEHGPEQEDEPMPSTHGPVGKEAIEAKPVGYQGPGDPV